MLRVRVYVRVCVLQDRGGKSQEVRSVLASGRGRPGGLRPHGSAEPEGGPPHPLQPHLPPAAQHRGAANTSCSQSKGWTRQSLQTIHILCSKVLLLLSTQRQSVS